jgi:two-component system CheB/CheR fusion protein
VVTYSNISDLKELQRNTRLSQEYAQNIVDTVREPLLVLDKEFTITSASSAFFRMFGTEIGPIVGKNLFKIQNLQWDVNKLRALIENILPKETTVESFDLTLIVKGLRSREMMLNARRIESGLYGEELILLAMEDVTEQRLVQQITQDREVFLSAVLDGSPPEAIVTIDEAGIVGSFSSGAEGIFGYSADEVVGKDVQMLMPELDRNLAHFINAGDTANGGIGRDLEVGHKDGTSFPVRLKVAELALGGTRHFLGFLHDLTADQKRHAEEQRSQKMEAVGQLTGGLAHDFNNLLTVVIGNLELLEMQTDDPKIPELLDEALEASNLGAALTSQLLSFSKSQALVPEHVALNELVETTQPLLERTIGSQIHIETQLANNLD